MIRFAGSAAIIAILHAGVAIGQATQPEGFSNWAFDELTLVNGYKFQGLILSEMPEGIWFRSVSRPPGRPTVTLKSFFSKSEIADKGIKRLSAEARKTLTEALVKLDPSGEGERLRMESLEILSINWLDKPGGGKSYESDHFML
ncbi:MAG TPA: hypothetical protein VG097_11250, partial [Gemmata sp.]|nr:hypothetical protein [Gemmata sp.]